MTTKEVAQMIAGIGLPNAYDHFDKDNTPGHPPFICFMYPSSENFFADDSVYQKFRTLRIELYTNEKELSLEEAVENAMDAAGIVYDSSETYIESENMYMVVWETNELISKEDEVPDTTVASPDR